MEKEVAETIMDAVKEEDKKEAGVQMEADDWLWPPLKGPEGQSRPSLRQSDRDRWESEVMRWKVDWNMAASRCLPEASSSSD